MVARSAPHGTVTVLFTDIVSSTERMQQLGDDRYHQVRRRHFELLRSALPPFRGHEVKSDGDAIMAVFASSVDAIGCATVMQQKIHQYNSQLDSSEQLLLRVGLDVGEPIREEDGDYHGIPVVIASRLANEAEGGQILLTQLVRRLAGSRGGYTFQELGPRSLKGILEPVDLCEIVWEPFAEGSPQPAPPIEQAAVIVPIPPALAATGHTRLVGRDQELSKLAQLWQTAAAGERILAFIVGDAGIGKSRLVAEFAQKAHGDGAAVLFGRADKDGLSEYQPIEEALSQYIDALNREVRADIRTRWPYLERLVPQLQDGGNQGEPAVAATPVSSDERIRLHQSAASFMHEIACNSPALLVLENLQWAKRPMLQLLKQFVTAPQPAPLLIVGTYQETELGPAHPLAELVADLRRVRPVERIELNGLNRDDVITLVGERVGKPCSASLGKTLYEETEGNPFFVEELLRHLDGTGALSERDGEVTTTLLDEQIAMPDGVKDVISRRLAGLSLACNNVLTIAAVIGRSFGLDALERASGLSADQLLDALDEAVQARIVIELPGTTARYRFAQSLIHEALYDALTTTRRVRLHGQTLQYADSNGTKLAYEVLGEAGPYIIVVGLSNCPAVRSMVWTFTKRWERMSRTCRVLLYDRRGVGFSAAPERGYSLLASVEDVRAVLDAAGVERAVVWGFTDGGPLAIAVAAQHPERTAGVILSGTSARCINAEDFDLGISSDLVASFLRTDAVDQGRAVVDLTRRRRESYGSGDISQVMRRVPRRAWSKIVAGLGDADARLLLDRVRAPTLIIHDPDNAYIPVGAAHYLHERITDSQLEIADTYGKPVWDESLYDRIEAFIEQVTAAGSR